MVAMAMMLQVLTVWVLVMKWLRIGCVGFFSSPPLISLVLCWWIEECSLSSLMLTPCKANWWVQGVVDPEVTGKWAPVLGKIAVWTYMKPKKVFCKLQCRGDSLGLPVSLSFKCWHTISVQVRWFLFLPLRSGSGTGLLLKQLLLVTKL